MGLTASANDLSSQLAELRRRKRLYWALFAAFLPLGVLVMAVGLFDPMYFGVVYLAVFQLAGIRVWSFPCPRCQRPVSRYQRFWHNPWVRKCIHCKAKLT